MTSQERSCAVFPESSIGRWQETDTRDSAAALVAGECGWKKLLSRGSISGELKEALDRGANLIVTACPFCLIMLEDGTKAKDVNEQVKTKDIAEVLWESVN